MSIEFQEKCIFCERNIFKCNLLNCISEMQSNIQRKINDQCSAKSAYFVKNKCNLLNY